MARIVIGTSGWHYASWRGPFYPDRLLARHQLRYYASQFKSAELNGVFYRTPTEAAVRGWREETGNDFVFAWKASKFITHWKRLSEKCDNSIELLNSRYKLLGKKGGPVLFQLPPNFSKDLGRLRSFIELLPPAYASVSNSGIPAGTAGRFFTSCPRRTLPSAFPITTMRPLPGNVRQTSST